VKKKILRRVRKDAFLAQGERLLLERGVDKEKIKREIKRLQYKIIPLLESINENYFEKDKD